MSIWTYVVCREWSDASETHKMIVGFLTLVMWLFFFWWLRPWFHGIVLPLFHIGLPLTLILIGLIGFAIFAGIKEQSVITVILVVLAVIFFIWPTCFSGPFFMKALYENTEYKKTEGLPQIEKMRLLPLSVAKRYADDSFQESREKLSNYTIVNKSGELVWQAPRVPDGFFIYFSNKMGGVVEVSSENSKKQIHKETFSMEISEGVAIEDNIRFYLYKRDYWIYIPDAIYYLNDVEKEQWVAVVPFIEYRFSFPVRYPAFGGVYLVYDDGTIVKLNPKDCDKSELLQGNVFYPEWLHRKEVEAYAYHKGINNKLFQHEDQIEVADVLESGNPQPYLLMSENGPTWFTAAEPYGKAFGILKVFTRSASKSKEPINILEYSEDSILTGPRRTVGYVRSSRNVTVPDWRSYATIETRPAPINNVLYWQLSIVPYSETGSGSEATVDKDKSFTGVYATVFIDSRTNEVFAFKDDENVIKFTEGKWDVRIKNDFDMLSSYISKDITSDDVKSNPIEVIDRIIQELIHLKQELE